MKKYGVIDLGSNSIRLVVFAIKRDVKPPLTKNDFTELITTKKTAGLSGYVTDGVFSKTGVDKAADTLRDFIKRAKIVGCEETYIFATAVIRNCKNSKEVLKEIEERISHPIDLISGSEEARLDMIGACCDRDISSGTLVDIGGGSTELVAIKNNEALHMVSLDQGSMSSFRNFVSLILPTSKECDAIRKALKKRIANIENEYTADRLYGVGGSIRAACKLKGAIAGKPKSAKVLKRSDITRMLDMLENDKSEFAHQIAQVIPDRIHTISCALVIMDTLMSELGASEIEMCKFGIREGYLIDSVVLPNDN